MKRFAKSSLTVKPENEQELSQRAERLLHKADAVGVLPTPIDDVVKAARITEVNSLEEFREGFLSKLKKSAREKFKISLQKVRGVADLRKSINYVPTTENPPRVLWVKAHELGHQSIPWHNVDHTYFDDDLTLSPRVEEAFEQEANFFGSEIIFQGKHFRLKALDYKTSLNSALELSNMHGASKHVTLWKYVEIHDETIALAQYYPSNSIDDHGHQVLRLWKTIPSLKFKNKYPDIKLPKHIRTGHPWVATRDIKKICDGKERINIGESKVLFEWETWWSGYTLFVLLRRKPTLSLVGRVLR